MPSHASARSSASSSAIRLQVESALAHRVPSALTVREKPVPAVFPTGIAAIDALTGLGGLPRSALTEICGPASSGRTSVLLSLLAQATARQEACALIDASDAFHPASAQTAGVELARVLWVRCGREPENLLRHRTPRNTKAAQEKNLLPQRALRDAKVEAEQKQCPEKAVGEKLKAMEGTRGSQTKPRAKDFDRLEQALKATDLLLQSGGFGLLIVDLSDLQPEVARRVPLTSWFRFRRAVEATSTALIVMEPEPFAGTCASLVLRFRPKQAKWSSLFSSRLLASEFYLPAAKDSHCAAPSYSRLLDGLGLDVEVIRARKHAQSSATAITTRTAWAG